MRYPAHKPTTRQRSDVNEFVSAESHAREKPLLAGFAAAEADTRCSLAPRLPLQANGFSQPGFRSERGLKITEIRYLQVTFRLKKSIVHFVLWMANRQ